MNKRFYGFGEVEHVPRDDKFEAYYQGSAVAEPVALAALLLDDMKAQGDTPLAVLVGRDWKSGEYQVFGVARHVYRGWGK